VQEGKKGEKRKRKEKIERVSGTLVQLWMIGMR
jgi:hypothetical protein